jgi:hypothetical protein
MPKANQTVILSPFGGSPGHEGFLRAIHVSHVRFWAGTRTKSGTEKRRAAGQRRAKGRPTHPDYDGPGLDRVLFSRTI